MLHQLSYIPQYGRKATLNLNAAENVVSGGGGYMKSFLASPDRFTTAALQYPSQEWRGPTVSLGNVGEKPRYFICARTWGPGRGECARHARLFLDIRPTILELCTPHAPLMWKQSSVQYLRGIFYAEWGRFLIYTCNFCLGEDLNLRHKEQKQPTAEKSCREALVGIK